MGCQSSLGTKEEGLRINIRAFHDSDYDRANALLKDVQIFHAAQRPDIYKTSQNFTPQVYYAEFLRQPEALSAVAEDDGMLAGICLVSIEEQGPEHAVLASRRYGSIEVLCVDSAFRRQGVAEKLIEYVKTRAETLKLDGLDLSVAAFNFPAKALYDKLGFTIRSSRMEWKSKQEKEKES